MTAVRMHSCSIHAGAVFKVPILYWTAKVPSRFFRALYGSLNEMLLIQPSDLIAPAGVSLGDVSAGLRIFGGSNTLTLKANALIATFPNITADRMDFVNSVIFQSYEALRNEFNELEIKSIEANAGYHFEITGEKKNAKDILDAGRHTELEKRAENVRDAVVEPAMRFQIVGKDGKWSAKVTVEKSELVQNGVFLLREIIVSDLGDYNTTRQQFDLVERIENMILELVGLNFEIEGSDAT